MLSGRFRCCSLLQHFPPTCSGICELCDQELEDLPHILLPRCPHLLQFARNTLAQSAAASNIFERIFLSVDEYSNIIQFLLDPSAVPEIIAANQNDSTVLPLIFRVTTTWCYSINRTRLKLMGRWTWQVHPKSNNDVSAVLNIIIDGFGWIKIKIKTEYHKHINRCNSGWNKKSMK